MQLLAAQVTGLQSSLTQHTNGQQLKQLKDELSTLKGLLLNRHQFPASPTPGSAANMGGAKIPDWQRTQALPNTGSSIPVKTLIVNQQECSSPDEAGTSLKVKGDEAAVSMQNNIKVSGYKEEMACQEDMQPQALNQETM